jgi:hypothetical protein
LGRGQAKRLRSTLQFMIMELAINLWCFPANSVWPWHWLSSSQNHGLVWSASLALSSPDKQDMRLDLPGSSLESRKSPCYCVLAARARGGVISGAGTQDPVWLYSRSPLCTSHREQFSHPISSGPTAGPIGRTYPGPGWRWSPGLRSCWSREWPGAAAV